DPSTLAIEFLANLRFIPTDLRLPWASAASLSRSTSGQDRKIMDRIRSLHRIEEREVFGVRRFVFILIRICELRTKERESHRDSGQSPGLRGTSNPGKRSPSGSTPTGLQPEFVPSGAQPLQG